MTNAQAEPRHRIVVGVDGSSSSTAVVEWAARQAEMTGSTLEAVTTWEWPTTYGIAATPIPDYDPAADARNILDGVLQAVQSSHTPIALRSIVVEGHPARTLVEESRGADLLVVGCRGLGEFSGMLLGSVSEYCITNADCPVLVYRDQR
ncbi:MAG: universal stress protein [Acidimicrobiales bacterium]|nr:universal stress protein [Acidimicrobiales bacterium]